MVQFILDNLEVITLFYFFVNTFIAGGIFVELLPNPHNSRWWKTFVVFIYLLFGLIIIIYVFSESYCLSLTRKLPLQAIWRLYFHPNLKKGVITQDQVNFVNRIAKYHKNSNSLGDRMYRWYVGKINKRFAKQNKERYEN